MKKKALGIIWLLAFCVLSAPAQQPKPTATPVPAPPQTSLKVGQAAPDFALTDTEGKTVKLSDFKGKKSVVLAFYVLAFTGG